ncbi:MAG: hypothetical protein ACOVN0_19245 [Niveispirillum sp.]|uniref:hypothetical protein n=1 Tax=Niveispirillum sp. TaxID=1917217 RepID=UPI003BA6E438
MIFIANQIGAKHSTENKNAIVTLLIGDSYINSWSLAAQSSWINYAVSFGFDIIIITSAIDTSEIGTGRSPAWQKLLILEQPWAKNYERIVWIDADIIINPTSANILESAPDPRQIGVAGGRLLRESPAFMIMNERMRGTYLRAECWPETARSLDIDQFERALGMMIDQDIVMYNTGVLVISPTHHRDLFRNTYRNYVCRTRLYEQPALCYEMHKSGQIQEISALFNWPIILMRALYFPETLFKQLDKDSYKEMIPMIRKELANCYFLHFAGCMSLFSCIQDQDLGFVATN